MRMSQPMGLPTEAQKFLQKHAKRVDPCEHCKRHSGYVKRRTGDTGMFHDVPIFEYTLDNGGHADEFIQHTIWSSGPMEWFGLKIFDTKGVHINTIEWCRSEFEEFEENE